jgi:hypothetical protein
MGYLYFDESIQDRGRFIIGALVYSDRDLSPDVELAIAEVGLVPRVDEYKSSNKMEGDHAARQLRAAISELLQDTQIAIVVLPSKARASLGIEAATALSRLIDANGLTSERHEAFFDEGIQISEEEVTALSKKSYGACRVYVNQNSKLVSGIQVADLAAHYAGTMLAEQMGLTTKIVKAGDDSGYDPDLQIELGFEIWARLRYAFFKEPRNIAADEIDGLDMVDIATFNVKGFGLFVANSCDSELSQAANQRFGTCYLGCVH